MGKLLDENHAVYREIPVPAKYLL